VYTIIQIFCHSEKNASEVSSKMISADDTISSTSDIRYGTDKYIQYIPGGIDSKIIISVPHGGNLNPKCIPCRQENFKNNHFDGVNKICTKTDLYTKEISVLLRDELVKISSEDKAPHLVICNLHRNKIDLNRNIKEACLSVPESIVAYNEYHQFLHEAKKSVNTGLLFDLHGQSHPEEWTELGYLIPKLDLLKDNLCPEKSSIRSLASRSTFSFHDLINGPASLGKQMQDEGIKTLPSPDHEKTEGNYFTGGYNVYYHGSLLTGTVDAIQLEVHRKYRSKEQSSEFVSALARAIKKYMDLHYGGL